MFVVLLVIMTCLGWVLSILAVATLSGAGVGPVLLIWVGLMVLFGSMVLRAATRSGSSESYRAQEWAAELEALEELGRLPQAGLRGGAAAERL